MAASRVACASFNIGTNTTISITRDSNNYTHTITFKFGSYTGTIATKTSSTTVVWTPDASKLYAEIKEATRGYGTVTCQTYNGNTLVGTTTAGFYASAVKENCLPTVTASIVDTNTSTIAVTGNSAKLVCYLSKPKVTMTATPKNSASIKSQQIYNPVGLTATTSPYTFDTVYSKDFICKATDSRGYVTEKTFSVDFVEYAPVYFSDMSLKRTESTSTTATLILKGYCFKGNFGAVDNTLTIKYRYKVNNGSYGEYITVSGATWNADGTFSVTTNITNLALNSLYTFEIIVQDKLTSFGDGETTILNQAMGDIRIGKNNIKFKNYLVVGDNNATDWKGFIAKRNLSGKTYDSLLGTGNIGNDPLTSIELKEGQSILGRIDLRKDGHLYNFLSNMSIAEIMSTGAAEHGYCLLNGGNSAPILIQWGRVSITPAGANVLTQAEINFPYQFQGLPMIFTDKITWDSDVVFTNPYAVENRKFLMHLKRHNVVTTVIQWVAIGNGSNALPE